VVLPGRHAEIKVARVNLPVIILGTNPEVPVATKNKAEKDALEWMAQQRKEAREAVDFLRRYYDEAGPGKPSPENYERVRSFSHASDIPWNQKFGCMGFEVDMHDGQQRPRTPFDNAWTQLADALHAMNITRLKLRKYRAALAKYRAEGSKAPNWLWKQC
jgi:hypothetical protein